jgi:lipid-A-disaccharide synthase
MTTVLLAVGDVSGDAVAADFVGALRELRPEARFLGLGGVEMEKRGVELVAHQRDLAVGGIFELAPSLRQIARAWRRLGAALADARPDLAVLVDSSGFNLPFARRARRVGVPFARSRGGWTAWR